MSSENKTIRVVLVLALVGLVLLLAQFGSAWAQPQQDALRQTYATPPATPTNGPTSTGTPTAGPCIQRLLLHNVSGGYGGAQDTWIDSYQPDYPRQRDGGLKIKGGESASVLIRFDLAGLPTNANIVAAELLFYVDAFIETRPLEISAYRMLRLWDMNQATWNSAMNGVAWGAGGANLAGVDRLGTPDDTITLTHRAVYRGLDVTDSLRYWAQHPDQNYGWLIKGTPASFAEYILASSRNQIEARRPVLRIDYSTCAVTSTATPTTGPVTPSTTPSPTATPQPVLSTFDATQDTFIDEWAPTSNYGSLGYMYCRGTIKKMLVQFDLSALPQGAQVISATLHLRTGSSAGNPITVSAYRLRRSWEEFSATWQRAATGQNWATAGASNITLDYDPQALSTTNVQAADQDYAWDVTQAAQAWVNEGQPNAGLLLYAQSNQSTQYSFLSSEVSPASYRPRLIVKYFVAAPTPTPSHTPAATVTETATPGGSGQIVGIVYQDLNHNAMHDPGEPGLGGALVELRTLTQFLSRQITGDDGSYAFEGLAVGSYRVREYNPWGYFSSTVDEVVTYVGTGSVSVTFGDIPGSTLAVPLIFK